MTWSIIVSANDVYNGRFTFSTTIHEALLGARAALLPIDAIK